MKKQCHNSSCTGATPQKRGDGVTQAMNPYYLHGKLFCTTYKQINKSTLLPTPLLKRILWTPVAQLFLKSVKRKCSARNRSGQGKVPSQKLQSGDTLYSAHGIIVVLVTTELSLKFFPCLLCTVRNHFTLENIQYSFL